MLTNKRFREIEERLEAATEGPWSLTGSTEVLAGYGTPDCRVIADTNFGGPVTAQQRANAEFLAHARADIGDLLDAVRGRLSEGEPALPMAKPDELTRLREVAHAGRRLLLCGYEFDWQEGVEEYADRLHAALDRAGGEWEMPK